MSKMNIHDSSSARCLANEPDMDEPENGATVTPLSEDGDTFTLRSYQDEMLEESLKRNTIIALDTGAGKTHM